MKRPKQTTTVWCGHCRKKTFMQLSNTGGLICHVCNRERNFPVSKQRLMICPKAKECGDKNCRAKKPHEWELACDKACPFSSGPCVPCKKEGEGEVMKEICGYYSKTCKEDYKGHKYKAGQCKKMVPEGRCPIHIECNNCGNDVSGYSAAFQHGLCGSCYSLRQHWIDRHNNYSNFGDEKFDRLEKKKRKASRK